MSSHCPICGHPFAYGDPQLILDALPISDQQRRIADRLARNFGRFVGRELLLAALFGDRADGGPATADKVLHVEVCVLRQRLRYTPLAIESHRQGTGSDRRLTWRDAPAVPA